MSRNLVRLTAVLVVLGLPVGFAHALMIMMPVGPAVIANSDAVFVGKVTSIEPAEVDAKPFPQANETMKYKIAVVQINENIRGVKDVKSVRIGFMAPTAGGPKIIGRPRNPQLAEGQEGLFIISMHSDGKFYQAPNFGAFVASADGKFKADVEKAKRVVTVMDNTNKALKSQDADERLLAATILVTKYRTQRGQNVKEEPIDAAESKLILNAIANANWGPTKFGEPNPYQLFNQLGINAQDGWNQPMQIRSQDDLRDAVQAWVKAKGEGYRIKRFVAENQK